MVDTDSNEETFSMDDLEKDLKRSRGARRLPWFAAGLVLGVAGTILVPRFLGPYLPGVFSGRGEALSGPVLAEERDGDRLLLTIETAPGALIASFSHRVTEIAQLVEPGDTVTISARDYDPFIEDPDFEGVKKARRTVEGGGPGAVRTAPGGAADTTDAATTDSTPAVGADTSATVDTAGVAGSGAPTSAIPDSTVPDSGALYGTSSGGCCTPSSRPRRRS